MSTKPVIWRNETDTKYWHWVDGLRCEVSRTLALSAARNGSVVIKTADKTKMLLGTSAALDAERRQPWRF